MRVYVASKLVHAPKWIALRDAGINVVSTWIDNPTIPPTDVEMEDLWVRCIAESAASDVILAYREEKEILKGSFIEIGSALACGATIFAVGFDYMTFIHHPRVTVFPTLDDALIELEARKANEEYEAQISASMEPDQIEAADLTFEEELRSLINRYSKENGSNTPDFILAAHLSAYIDTLSEFMKNRDAWYDINKYDINGAGPVSLPENPAVAYFEKARENGDTRQYQKTAKTKIRKATPGKVYETVINGIVETTNTAKKDSYEVRGESGEIYLISEEKLKTRYVWENNDADGWGIYAAIGKVHAVCYYGNSLVFKAPWGEDMICNEGDFLCSTGGSDDVYRIERDTFFRTYSPLPRVI